MLPRRRGQGILVANVELQQEVRQLRARMEDMETSMKRKIDTGDINESEETKTSKEEEGEETTEKNKN